MKHRNSYSKQSAIKTSLAGLAVLLVLGAVLLSLRPGAANNDGKVKVVAGENFWGDIVTQIGGQYVSVTSIISDPNTDPHLYESDARDAGAVAAADVVLTNGLGYDDFMTKLLAGSHNNQRQVLTAADILGAVDADANPHLWYDTPRLPVVAQKIELALAAKDPAHKAVFEANLTTFDGSLQPVLNVISEIKAKYPDAPVAYTERVPGYLLDNAGLSVRTPAGFAQAIEDGNDPSPADTLAMNNLMARHGVKVLLYNAQATSAVTQHVLALAKAAGIPVVGVTETMPKGAANFQAWQLAQAQALLKALEQ